MMGRAVSFLAVALTVAVQSSSTCAAADFYEGKRITIVTAGTAGAGLDAYVRLAARHFGRYVPGQPTVIVQNMPGAGSYNAAEYVEAQAPRDGTYVGSVFPGAIMAPLLDAQKPRFDPTRFVYLGTAETGPRICLSSSASKIKTLEALLKSHADQLENRFIVVTESQVRISK